jgi:hypothetical protein
MPFFGPLLIIIVGLILQPIGLGLLLLGLFGISRFSSLSLEKDHGSIWPPGWLGDDRDPAVLRQPA